MALDNMPVELTVVLGRKQMPLYQLLRMGRGAIVDFDGSDSAAPDDERVEILANGHPIAHGQVAVRGLVITVEVTGLIRGPTLLRTPGSRIGDVPSLGLATAEISPA